MRRLGSDSIVIVNRLNNVVGLTRGRKGKRIEKLRKRYVVGFITNFL